MLAELAACVVQGLVERAARRAEPVGEDVDGHSVQRERDEDAPLVGRQDVVNPAADSRQQLALLGLGIRLEPLAGEEAPLLGLERDLPPLPGAFSEPDRSFEQRELVGPRREAARAAEAVEAR